MQAINIVGFKNSGKTTLTLLLAEALEAQGYRVALVKHSHNALDKAHTDTERMLHGGLRGESGRTVLALGKDECALFWSKEQSLGHMLSLLDADFVLVEGGKHIDFMPRILCLRDTAETEELHKGLAIASFGAPCAVDSKYTLAQNAQYKSFQHTDKNDIIPLAKHVAKSAFVLPRLNCGGCGYENCFAFARAMVAGERRIHECVALQSSLDVTFEGKAVALNPFMERLYTQLLRSMMRELKGVHGGRITIGFDL